MLSNASTIQYNKTILKVLQMIWYRNSKLSIIQNDGALKVVQKIKKIILQNLIIIS